MSVAARGQRVFRSAMPGPVVTLETKWALFHDAWLACLPICDELAKYQYYWDARTVWLMAHADEYETPRFQERRAKRNAMAERWNDLRLAFCDAARLAGVYAGYLGPEHVGTIWDRYGVDYRTQPGERLDVYLTQWREWLRWNPERCPF